MPIPTEPIGSIPRPIELIAAIAKMGADDPRLNPMYDAAIRDTVAKLHRFRARDHRFIIHGVCDECAKLRSRDRRQDRV